MNRLSVSLSLLLLCSCLAGCGGGGGGSNAGGETPSPVGSVPTSTRPVVNVAVAPANSTLTVGQTLVFSALGTDSSTTAVFVAAKNWTWTTSDSSVASITAVGDHATLTALKVGTVTVTAKESASGTVGSTTLTTTAASAGSGSGSGSGANDTVVYTNDFTNGVGLEWSDQTTSITPGTARYPATKFLGEFANKTVSLTVTNLPAHGNVTLEFDLFIIRTWDGNYTVQPIGPDPWNLNIEGGPALLNTTFTNIDSALAAVAKNTPFFQAYPGTYPGASNPYQTGASMVNALGYTFQGVPNDAVYHIRKTVPHTADSVKFNFVSQQSQPIADESWGLKNVVVSVSP